MKKYILFIIACLSLHLSAQTEEYSGTYVFNRESEKNEVLEYKLDLNGDGTFQFTSYRTDIGKNEYHHYSKGKWTVKNKVIHFSTEDIDLEEKITLDFTGTTARIIKKSPRDMSDKVVPTALQFYKSKIFWIANLKLIFVE
ncbi:hypothetical protein [Flavobacterium sp. UBA6135]|uniref:hypothetical protein n=1 Tax=Flavobacterium sp. UBA6135 TaxID=1946553 RepID=UPI0025C0C29C|nr:hypothetical protein [Flavobacterium sp. UBA6135]